MSDEHDRIARLLREQGQAEAPPDLVGDVMAQVRREPQATPAWRRTTSTAGRATTLGGSRSWPRPSTTGGSA